MILPGAVQPDPGHLQQALRLPFDDLKGFFPEAGDDAFGQLGADALDQTGTEIAFDPRHAAGQHLFADFDLELFAVLGVGVPTALQAQVLPRREFRQVADHRGQPIEAHPGQALPPGNFRAQAQHGIPVFRVVEGDALDGTGKIIHRNKYTRQGKDLMARLIINGNFSIEVNPGLTWKPEAV